MPAAKYAGRYDRDARTDGTVVGKKIREIVRLMTEDGMTWQNAADAVGVKRSTAYKALHKPHVLAYRREKKKELTELLSTRIPHKLSALMDSENHAAGVRAALALEALRADAVAVPTTQIRTGGIIIQLVAEEPRALPHAAPALELADETDPATRNG
ncbi:MAG: hypothetical protein WB689_22575 [Xanthobacteraceae bacterium]